ncbi:MAG: hypothetical protein ACLFO5_07920, partial [Opitutales bacterium]
KNPAELETAYVRLYTLMDDVLSHFVLAHSPANFSVNLKCGADQGVAFVSQVFFIMIHSVSKLNLNHSVAKEKYKRQ